MSAAPRLAAVLAWQNGGRLGEIGWPPERWPDPPEWGDADARACAVLVMASSGAMAELSTRRTTVDDSPLRDVGEHSPLLHMREHSPTRQPPSFRRLATATATRLITMARTRTRPRKATR